MVSMPSVHVVVTCCNASPFIERCLVSIQRQSVENCATVVVDDASSDGTHRAVRKLVTSDPRFRIERLSARSGAARARQHGLGVLDAAPHDLVVLVDGDDWLLDGRALEILRSFHLEHRLLVAYGRHQSDPGWSAYVGEYPLVAKISGRHRSWGWRVGHPRSFRYGLWGHVPESALRDRAGADFRSATDLALFLPMLELAGTRSRLLDRPLYHYNRGNPLSRDRVDPEGQLAAAEEILSRPSFRPLPLEEQRRLLGEAG